MISIAVNALPSPDWDDFIREDRDASVYMLSGWPLLARDVFGHDAWFLEARDSDGKLIGALPVIQQKSVLFGNFATSIAFFNYGGAAAQHDEVARQLMTRACEVARKRKCRYLEFRGTRPLAGHWAPRTDKVTMILELPETFERLAKSLGSKLRSQVKRAEREGAGVRIGGAELIDDFYGVFAENMRDLGTPVYPKEFFAQILRAYGEFCRIVVVDAGGVAGAAALLVIWRGGAEVPWAACRGKFRKIGLNMKLYWELLATSVEMRCRQFDFGRSTADSGTFKFKQQWGATARPLYWYRWRAQESGGAVQPDSDGRLMLQARRVWGNLPLSVANLIGPRISGGLPW